MGNNHQDGAIEIDRRLNTAEGKVCEMREKLDDFEKEIERFMCDFSTIPNEVAEMKKLMLSHIARQTASLESIENNYHELSEKYRSLTTIEPEKAQKLKHAMGMDIRKFYLGALLLFSIISGAMFIPGFKEVNFINGVMTMVALYIFGESTFSKIRFARDGGGNGK